MWQHSSCAETSHGSAIRQLNCNALCLLYHLKRSLMLPKCFIRRQYIWCNLKKNKKTKTNYQRQLLLRFVTPRLIHYTIQILNNALDNNASASNASVYLIADRQRGDFFLSYAISNDWYFIFFWDIETSSLFQCEVLYFSACITPVEIFYHKLIHHKRIALSSDLSKWFWKKIIFSFHSAAWNNKNALKSLSLKKGSLQCWVTASCEPVLLVDNYYPNFLSIKVNSSDFLFVKNIREKKKMD